MLRLYRLPRKLHDHQEIGKEAFFEKKRLLAAFAARTNVAKLRRDGQLIEYTQYLVISAMPLDVPNGVCSALLDNRCSIYERRPLSCRTVPFHYSRAEVLAEQDLQEFVSRPEYQCDTGELAQVALENGKIVHDDIRRHRTEAIDLALGDGSYNKKIIQINPVTVRQYHYRN